jgi:hypothetical protein
VMPSSETGNSLEGALGSRSRRGLARGGRPALERGGTSPKGASSPRARRNLARGGDRSSSEAKLYRYGAVPSSARGWLGRLSGGPWVCFARVSRFVCVCFL